MLDRYFYGEVKRISPEAPVPVTHVKKVESVLGGSANVAANLAQLGCQVFVGGVTGDDANRVLLEEMLAKLVINYDGLLKSSERATITKMRVIGSKQQMLRLDFEEIGDLSPESIDFLKEWLANLLDQGLDGIVISDYAKGVCSDFFCQKVIKLAHAYNIPVLVDPKGTDWHKYTGADFITPNLKELSEVKGNNISNEDSLIVEQAKDLRQQYTIKNLVVTRSEKGMTLVGDRKPIHAQATAKEVFDVSGAGDTVAAVLLAAVAGGIELQKAVELANLAAGIVVSKVGTYPVRRSELLKEVLTEQRRSGMAFRPLMREEVAALSANWHASGEKIVFTNGCFDLLHVGHVTYLEKAARLGKHLIVGLNTDASVKRLKGETRPLVGEYERARVLAALACVDSVVLFDEDTPAELIKAIKPDILVKGGDYLPEEVVGREDAGEVQIIDFEEGFSTTGIIEKIAKLVKNGKL
ncbi:MAG TPA: D-glycero-beta-D-manno-heptose-7-phosphate kinase [Candidatus Avacidaminococcus intestinavium]|uniref:Bifunctional protein HldE n=1 Tax=Candidatus Avacidaminococcus intestinavium TaxID=2840684 RepID=A0A9D1MNU7_9FIRM|nr:D-glycero-beta-D-manno-heptose-7-phosphate kinase [Candidatus Avacidaminococcus intestinavium]